MVVKKRAKGSLPSKDGSKSQALWNLWRDGLTQSAINLWLQCKEQFKLNYIQGWTPRIHSEALAFGSAFHDCLTDWTEDWDIRYFHKELKQQVHSLPTTAPMWSAQEVVDFKLMLAVVGCLAACYGAKWADQDAKIKWLRREETFDYQCWLTTPFGKSNAGFVRLRGRWDGVFEDKQGDLWIHETKTKSQIDEQGIQGSLPFDTQSMLYAFTAEQSFKRPVKGILYDVVRRPGLRQKVNESKKDYLDRVKKDIADRPEWYFMRWEFSLSKNQVTKWVNNWLHPTLVEIAEWHEPTAMIECKSRVNPNALFTRYGKCDLFHLITKGITHGLYQRRVCFPELE